MKKIILLLVCAVVITLITAACGGDKKSAAPVTGNEKVDEIIEKAFADMSGMEKFQTVLKEGYNLSVSDVAPGYDYPEKNAKDRDYFYGDNNVNKTVTCMFAKKDGSEITKEEYKAYVQKIYDLTKSKSQDGKNLKGFDGGAGTMEEAMTEKTFEQLFASEFWPQDWCYRMDDVFYNCTLSLEDAKGEVPMRIKFSMACGLQKSLNEAMEDAEKALDDPEVQKVLKEKLGK